MVKTMSQRLPNSFQAVEEFVDTWALPTESQRHIQRLSSTMVELRRFYDAALARIDDMLAYLNEFPLDSLPPQAQTLLHLTLSLAEIAPAVELFGQPEVPDGYDSRRLIAIED